ncbi:MAG: T9SS type A sorting domain-containing protein, partial [Chitinophagaceae bacterium]
SWAMLTQVSSQSPSNLMYSLFNDNGTGGYSYYYSTSTANSGADFSTSVQEAPFRRAISTWRELTGLNFTYGGVTSIQQLNLGDGINLVMLDNTANGPSFVLPAGVLAVCYSGGYTCNGSQWILRAGFEIIIRNAGVSAGSASFNNGPCFTTGSAIDMESVILHELGHALNLGHIIDSYKGIGLPNIDPQKVMNFAIVNGVDRRSPDWAALAGARYNVNPRGLTYCYGITEMSPLPGVVNEPKDDCPLVFPSVPTAPNTSVGFDLDHAGSNRFSDPQYTRVLSSGAGTSITNNAWYVFRTDGTGTSISLAISNYTTSPATQATCTDAGVELSFYQVNSCPAGQAFPAPVAYRTFNANGPVTAVTGLAPNSSYLMMADGIYNTRASFTMTYIATVLPLRFLGFTAVKDGAAVRLDWQVASETGNDHFDVMLSRDGRDFTSIATIPSKGDNENVQDYSSLDRLPFSGVNYYRIRQVDKDGRETFSKTQSVTAFGETGLSIYPNPAHGKLFIRGSAGEAPLSVSLYTITGNLIKRNELRGMQLVNEVDLQGLPAGAYIVEVQTSSGVQQQRFIKE